MAQLCRLITRGRRAAQKGSYALDRADVAGLLSPNASSCGCRASSPMKARDAGSRSCSRAICGSPSSCCSAAEDRKRLASLQRLGKALGLPLVASGDVHMHVRERRKLQDVLTAIRLNVPLSEAG